MTNETTSLKIITNNQVVHEVWKYVKSSEGEESVWCHDWPGRHVIGNDCNWYNLSSIKEETTSWDEIWKEFKKSKHFIDSDSWNMLTIYRVWEKKHFNPPTPKK